MREMTVNTAWQAANLALLQQQSVGHAYAQIKQWQHVQLDNFIKQGFPTRRQENWKYTNVASLAQQAFTMTHTDLLEAQLTLPQLADCYRLVFVNGQLAHALCEIADIPDGVELTQINSLLTHADWQQYLPIAEQYQTGFSTLNSALLTNGVVLRIARNVVLPKPLHIVYINTQKAQSVMTHARHIIVAEQGSSAEVFEEYYGDDDTNYFNNIVTQIYAQANTQIDYYKLQREGRNAFHIANTIIQQHRDSRVYSNCFSYGGRLSRDDLNYALTQPGAQCQLLGLYLAQRHGHIDNHTRIDHLVPQGNSRQDYKGIIADQAHAVFNGKVLVHPDAQQTCALQANQNLLLSPTAQVDTKPELEIYADDVQCSHGATVGQLNEQALFYLRSRGIDLQQAQHLLTCGFANDIIAELPVSALAEYIKSFVVAQLATPQCHGDCTHA